MDYSIRQLRNCSTVWVGPCRIRPQFLSIAYYKVFHHWFPTCLSSHVSCFFPLNRIYNRATQIIHASSNGMGHALACLGIFRLSVSSSRHILFSMANSYSSLSSQLKLWSNPWSSCSKAGKSSLLCPQSSLHIPSGETFIILYYNWVVCELLKDKYCILFIFVPHVF